MAEGRETSVEVIVEVPAYQLDLNEHELELIHNLLHAGPKLGFTPFRQIASELLGVIEDLRGEIAYEDRLFDYTDKNGDAGLEWFREEPYATEITVEI